MHFPHEDALVITLDVANFTIRQLLIDNGSSTNMIFWLALEVMRMSHIELEKSNSTLVGFDGKETKSSGSIKLFVIAKDVTELTSFFVINSSSTYNAILGRPWIHAMKVVPSTIH